MMPDYRKHPELLADIVDADLATGLLTWKWRDPAVWGAEMNRFNGLFAGKPAFARLDRQGYCIGSAGGAKNVKNFFAHRVIWALAYGQWPDGEIDHIDGNKKNNAISNLRCVTRSQNARNLPLPSNNKSGRIGVRRIGDKFGAHISAEGRCVHLGTFETFDAAVAARAAAEKAHGYHPGHGRQSA